MANLAAVRPYETAAYAAGSNAGCYWTEAAADPGGWAALEGEAETDFAVIGGGFTGLSAAFTLAEAGASVRVLDMHGPAWGASGRNGGFCCLGGAYLGRAAMVRRYGAAERAAYVATERAAIDQVAAFIEARGLDVGRHSDGEVILAHSPRAMKGLRDDVPAIVADYGVTPRVIEAGDLADEGLRAEGLHGGLHVPIGFGLNPRAYALGLAVAARDAGAVIHGQSPVDRLTRAGTGFVITTPRGRLRASKVLIATNGYASDDLPPWMRARVLPVTSSVLVTREMTEAEITAQGWTSDRMAYDTRHLLHYFRMLPERRMLFGMRGGIRWDAPSHARIKAKMRQDFNALFPAWSSVEAPYFWSGLAALARDEVPFCGLIDDQIWGAFAYHGNGVAMGSLCGRQMARMALGQSPDIPGFFQTAPKRWELGRWRRLSLRLAYVGLGVLDRL